MDKISEYNLMLNIDYNKLILSICLTLLIIIIASIIIWLNINSVVKKKIEKCNKSKKENGKRNTPLNNNFTDGLLAKYFMS